MAWRLLAADGAAAAAPLAAQGSGSSATELSVVVSLAPDAGAGFRALALLVDLPGEEVAEDREVAPLAGDLRIRLLDVAGGELSATRQSVEITGRGLQVYSTHRAPREAFVAEVTFEPRSVEGHARWSERFAAQGESSAIAWASSPLLVATRTGWEALRASNPTPAPAPYPFLAADRAAFLPIAEQRISPGEPVIVRALVASPDGEIPFLRARWVDATSRAAFEGEVEILGIAPAATPGVRIVRARMGSVRTPDRYDLRLAFVRADGSTGALSPRGVHVRVVGGAATADDVSTAGEDPLLRRLGAAPSADARLLEALRQLAGSGFERAGSAFAASVRAAVRDVDGKISSRRIEALSAAIDRVSEQLVGREPRSALPIAVLHVMAHRQFLASHDARLMSIAATAVRVAVRRGMAAGDDGAAAFGPDAVALVDPPAALELDPDQRLALLRVAIGDPLLPISTRSVAPLQRLVAAHPEDAHGRLRLGLALRRAGDARGAARELAMVADGEGESWCREVAYGELAALEEQRGRAAEAEAVLRRGIDATASPQLHLQLGAYLDGWNRSQDAVSVINRMPVARAEDRPSGRHLLKRGAADEIAATLRRVERGATGGLEALERVLRQMNGQAVAP